MGAPFRILALRNRSFGTLPFWSSLLVLESLDSYDVSDLFDVRRAYVCMYL